MSSPSVRSPQKKDHRPEETGEQQQQQQLQHKITRKQAFSSLLTDEELSDITLRGTDGTLVHANRCMLAARSEG